MNNRIVIIGAGAAGCFAAIEVKRRCPEAEVTVLEKGTKPLAKVAITGGGRCNLTNSFAEVKSLEQVYPRGFRLMKKLFHHFSPKDAYEWFEREGVRLVTQDDECVFPQSQDAMDVVRALLRAMKGVDLRLNTKVVSISCHSERSNPAGPSAEGIYFSGRGPKNQIPSAIANPTRSMVKAHFRHSTPHYRALTHLYAPG